MSEENEITSPSPEVAAVPAPVVEAAPAVAEAPAVAAPAAAVASKGIGRFIPGGFIKGGGIEGAIISVIAGYLIIVLSRAAAEMLRAIVSIANNTRK